MAFPVAAAISAGSSLLSGLFGKKDADKDRRRYEKAMKAAMAAEAEKYGLSIEQINALRQQLYGLLNSESKQGETDINTSYRNMESAGMQDMVNRGLTSTTILPSMRMGVNRERLGAMNRYRDQLLGRRMGIEQWLTQEMLNSIRGRTTFMPNAPTTQAPGFDFSGLSNMMTTWALGKGK